MKKAGVLDKISIEGVTCEAIMGVYPHERVKPRPVVFDIYCFLDAERAAQTDDVRDTVDYARIAEMIGIVVRDTSFRLIESLAELVAKTVLEFPIVQQVVVRLSKPGAIPGDVAISVEIRRRR